MPPASPSPPRPPRPARLHPGDAVRVAAAGLRARPLRVVLAALGIAIGIAATVAVVGVSASSRAALDRELDRIGTNLLTVEPGSTVFGRSAQLPAESVAMATRIGPVFAVSATGLVSASVYRTDRLPAGETGGIAVIAADPDLLGTIGGRIAAGAWLNRATAAYPATVLGARAARRLGIGGPGLRVWLGGQWFGVVGVLDPIALAPELDNAAIVGWTAAESYLRFDGHPTTLYCRSADAHVEAVRSVLATTVNPRSPNEVRVSRPSEALAARRAAERTLGGMLLGLGVVAVIVGGIGVANTMVISVLERRGEIGLRRALGATRGQIRLQFITESLLLSAAGGAAGVALGTLATVAYATAQNWPVHVPVVVIAGGVLVALPVGAAAGLYPASRAAAMAPVDALNAL